MNLIERFTEGDCWILATWLSHYTGLPVVEVWDSDWEGPFHWLVKPGPRTYLDVRGVQTIGDMHRHWGHFRCLTLPAAQTASWIDARPPETYEGSWRIGRRVARDLIRQHLEAV